MTRLRARFRPGAGLAVLAATASVTAVVLLAPHPARALLWLFSLTTVSVLAGLLLGMLERRMGALEESYRGTLEIISRLIDSVERYAENHSRRVAELSTEMASALGRPADEIEDIRVAALLHDLGKLDLPAEALAQAARLPPGWLDQIGPPGRHDRGPDADARGSLRRVVWLVACCRERWDGTGKRSLCGPEIPLGARILAVADAYDAVVTDRAYQKGRTHAEALEALRLASGTQFDPQVVEVFLRLRAAPAEAVPKAA